MRADPPLCKEEQQPCVLGEHDALRKEPCVHQRGWCCARLLRFLSSDVTTRRSSTRQSEVGLWAARAWAEKRKAEELRAVAKANANARAVRADARESEDAPRGGESDVSPLLAGIELPTTTTQRRLPPLTYVRSSGVEERKEDEAARLSADAILVRNDATGDDVVSDAVSAEVAKAVFRPVDRDKMRAAAAKFLFEGGPPSATEPAVRLC